VDVVVASAPVWSTTSKEIFKDSGRHVSIDESVRELGGDGD
jgi:hypothetical protein